MSERHAVLCCALLSLTLVLGPALGRMRGVGFAHEASTTEPNRSAAIAGRATVTPDEREGHGGRQAHPSLATSTATEAIVPTEASAGITPDPVTEAVSHTSTAVATEAPDPDPAPPPTTEAPTTPESLLQNSQVIVFYGTPLSSEMGILGTFPPAEAALRVRQQTAVFDDLNGERGAVPAFDLIYATAQAEQTGNGLYLRYLDDAVVRDYLRVAEENDVQLILDLQIGRGDVLSEVRKIERYLRNPRVHVAVDPEYAVGPDGVPLQTAGTITGSEINDVQAYLARLAEDNGLPPKLMIVHQYLEDTIVDPHDVRFLPNVDLVINMDGFGEAPEKVQKYEHFSRKSYSEHRGFNVFLNHDQNPMSEAQILRLRPFPEIVVYQ